MRRSSVLAAVVAAMAWASSAAAQEGYRIVVNPANPTSGLTKAQVSSLFLRKTISWEDGKPVAPVDQTDAAVRDAFARDVLGMSATSAFAQAQQAAQAGRGEPPVSVASDREVLAFVRLKPGAIGYVSAAAPLQGVKVLTVGKAGADLVQEPLLVGGAIKAPVKIVDARPLYPELARQTKAQGMVELEIVVGPEGSVTQAKVTKSIPLLDRAAIEAVKKWKYAPTVVNGVAVPIKMSVGLAFGL